MVFHYTNFVIETNEWWLRRVRPAWMTAGAMGCWFVYWRYYFYGKNQAKWARSMDDERREELAQINKRQWGYGHYFQPTLANSRKAQLYDMLGDNYKHAQGWGDRYMYDDRTVEELYKEETDEFEI